MKKLIIISSVTVAISFIVIAVLIIRNNSKTYLDTICSNWGIQLSESYKETYSIDSGTSFLGDGERYHVFKCDNFEAVEDDINWKKENNEDIKKKISSTIVHLAIKSDFELNLKADYEYYYMQKDDMSKLFIIHPLNSNLIYVIENFM